MTSSVSSYSSSSSSSEDPLSKARRKLGLGSPSSSSDDNGRPPLRRQTSANPPPSQSAFGAPLVCISSSSSSSDDYTVPPLPRQLPNNIGAPTPTQPSAPPPAAKGTTLELVGSYILRGGAGLIGGVTYGSLFLVGIITSFACAAPAAIVAIPFGAIGALVGLCVDRDYENGFNWGILIPGLPLVFLIATVDLPKFALCRSVGYLGAGALAFAITGQLDSPGAIKGTEATELIDFLIKTSCVGIGFFN